MCVCGGGGGGGGGGGEVGWGAEPVTPLKMAETMVHVVKDSERV